MKRDIWNIKIRNLNLGSNPKSIKNLESHFPHFFSATRNYIINQLNLFLNQKFAIFSFYNFHIYLFRFPFNILLKPWAKNQNTRNYFHTCGHFLSADQPICPFAISTYTRSHISIPHTKKNFSLTPAREV